MGGFIKWRMFWHTIKEIIPLVCILFLILTTLVFVQQLGKYSNLVLSFQSSPEVTQKLLLGFIPSIVVITLPVSLLLGAVIACSRLSSDNEMTAWQSLGISQTAIASPFLAIGLAGTMITCYLSAYVAPTALKRQKWLISQIVLQEANTRIKPHTFVTNFPNLLLYVQNVDPHTNDWLGVFLLKIDPGGVSSLHTAERGQFRIESGQSLSLEAQLFNGVSLEYQGHAATNSQTTTPSSQSSAQFAKTIIKLVDNSKIVDGADRDSGSARLNLMSLQEISEFAAAAKTDKEQRQALAERHRRFAFPFACLTLTAMTFILAVQGKRFSTRPRTVIVVLFMAMGFYLLLVMGHNLSVSGTVPVWLGVWFSNIVYGAIILKSLASSRPPWSGLTSLIKLPLAPGAVSDQRSARPLPSENQLGAQKLSRGVRVISLNLINYLLISEIVKYFALAASALVVTATIFTLFDLIPSIIKSGTPLPYAASYLAYLAPQLFYTFAPFALLVALLMSFNVLSRSNQLVVVASAGQNRSRTINAIIVTAGALSLTLWSLSNFVLPHTNREQDARYNKIKGRLVEQTTIALGSKWVFDKNDAIYSFQRVDPDNSLINTSIFRLDGASGVIRSATHFSRAVQVTPTTWKADSGWKETVNPDSLVERKVIQSQPEIIEISEGVDLFNRMTNESIKMSDAELYKHIAQLKDLGVSTLDLQIDLRKRAAFPFSCMVLAVLAIPFISAKQARRSGPLVSVSLSVGIGLIFRLLTELFEAVGKQNNLPVGMAVWGPHILFVAVGLYLIFVRHRLQ